MTSCNPQEPDLASLYRGHEGKLADKWRGYFGHYERNLGPFRDSPVSLLEVGIQNGGSIEIWSRYFQNAEILVGCDIDPLCGNLRFADSRIHVVVGDANSPAAQETIHSLCGTYDLIIDDGSHRSSDIIKTFCLYFPKLKEGGVFVVEDLHCSYWQEFEGGLFDPFSSISFFKNLCDIVNSEHWGIDLAPVQLLKGALDRFDAEIRWEDLQKIHSIEFVNSICFIRKAAPGDNVLGGRFVTGSRSEVNGDPLSANKATTVPYEQSGNPWARFSRPPAEELLEVSLAREGSDSHATPVDQVLASLNEENDRLQTRIKSIQSSLSWRLTAPLRSAHRFFRNIRDRWQHRAV